MIFPERWPREAASNSLSVAVVRRRIWVYAFLVATGLALVFVAAEAVGRSLGGDWGSVIGIVLVGVLVCAFSMYVVRRLQRPHQ